jgi:hypothetical protein
VAWAGRERLIGLKKSDRRKEKEQETTIGASFGFLFDMWRNRNISSGPV